MSAGCSCHMMCRACLAPAVAEFTRAACEACTHIGVTECEDRARLVHTFRCHEFEIAVFILRGEALLAETKVFGGVLYTSLFSPSFPNTGV